MRVARRPAVLAALGAAATVTVSAAVALASPSAPAPRGPVLKVEATTENSAPGIAPDGTTLGQRTTATVTLLTGQRLSVSSSPGGESVSVLPSAPVTTGTGSQTIVQFTAGADHYAVPAEAIPFMGSLLDPALFDVSYLVRAHLDDAHVSALPVTVTAAPGDTAVPGIDGVPSAGGTVHLSLAHARAPGLGLVLRSLAQQAGASSATLPRVSRIALTLSAGVPAPTGSTAASSSSTPGPAYHRLTIRFVDRDGAKGSAVGLIQNVDSSLYPVLGFGFDCGMVLCPGAHGSVTGLVPEGHYSVQVGIITTHTSASGSRVDTTLVAKPELTVSGDTAITLDARTGVPYSADVPNAHATFIEDDISTTRTAADQGALRTQGPIHGLMGLTAVRVATHGDDVVDHLFAAPTSPVRIGSYNFEAYTQIITKPVLNAPSSAPSYVLMFPHAGSIPANSTHQVPRSALTTVINTLYQDANTTSDNSGCTIPGQPPGNVDVKSAPGVYLPWGFFSGFGAFNSAPLGPYTQYWYSSEPTLTLWQNSALVPYSCRGLIGPVRRISPGQVLREDWGKGPIVPTPAAAQYYNAWIGLTTTQAETTLCTACRQDNNGMVNIGPFGDSSGVHQASSPFLSAVFNLANTWTFTRPGSTPISFGETDDTFTQLPYGATLPLLSRPARYALSWQVKDKTTPMQSNTQWVFESSPSDATHASTATRPCQPDPSRACSYLPLLFVTYQLDVDPHGDAPAGRPFHVRVGINGQQFAPAPPGVQTTVSTSTDDGNTWSSPVAARSLGGNVFDLLITNPGRTDGTGFVSLRIVARDAAGNTVTQTNIRAYGLRS